MIKAIIFDCFGVIVSYGFHAAYTQLGGDLDSDKPFLHEVFTAYNAGQLNDQEFLEQLSTHLNVDPAQVKKVLAQNEYIDLRLLQYIKNLRQNYKTALLSNVGRGGIERYFADVNLDDYFDEVIISGEVNLLKPDPAIFDLTAERLGVSLVESVLIDDGTENCRIAGEVGMEAIEYRNQTADDFDILKQQLENLLAAGADH